MRAEYRVVCSRFTEPFHGQHHKARKDKRAAVQSVIDQNKEAAALKSSYYDAGEAPWRMQSRQVTEWKDTP